MFLINRQTKLEKVLEKLKSLPTEMKGLLEAQKPVSVSLDEEWELVSRTTAPVSAHVSAHVPASVPAPVSAPVSAPTKKFYNTNIIDPTIKVFSLSDIHGDIQSFIITLRDLAEVIKKKKAPPINPKLIDKKNFNLTYYKNFSNNTYDDNMENILNLDLNTDENIYIDDLNYEWCGGNTHVVICGDIIDPQRAKEGEHMCLKENDLPCAYYPQIELKILMFINALNKQAAKTHGKIVKLFGNHDLGNILDNAYYKYTFSQDRKIDNYYKGIKRINIFKVGNPGFNLLVEDGIGILIKINNTIFVHGDLKRCYDTYDDLNQFINNPLNRNATIWEAKFRKQLDYNTEQSSLLSRTRGNSITSTIRATHRVRALSVNDPKEVYQFLYESKKFCADLEDLFINFVGDEKIITDNVNDLKLVIGHCTQHSISTGNQGFNVTYDKKIKENGIKEVFGENIYTGLVNFDRTDNRARIFGITMECPSTKTSLNRIYRVDVGSSRGFDNYSGPEGSSKYPTTLEEENRFLYSKTPQILEINTDGTINIIKSKMRNTRIHLPRPNYEKHVTEKGIEELNYNTTSHKFYKQKYLKYKNKYLQLKQLK